MGETVTNIQISNVRTFHKYSNIKWVKLLQKFKYQIGEHYKYSNIKWVKLLQIFKYQMGETVTNIQISNG